MKILDHLIPIADYVLGESGPHIVDPEIDRYVEELDVEIAKGSVHRDTLADAAPAALPNELGPRLRIPDEEHWASTKRAVSPLVDEPEPGVVSGHIYYVSLIPVVHLRVSF